jgi:general secretion pathway protein A
METAGYVKNRLTLAGASSAIIDENAILSAFASCGGSIRKLNLIITKSLMIGAQHNKQVIDTDIILAAVNEIQLI